MSGHLPDKAVVIRDSMQPFRESWHPRRREHVIDFPSLWIDADQRFKAVRIYPYFVDVIGPSRWRKKQFCRLRHSFRDLLAARTSPDPTAERIGPRLPSRRLR